MEAITIWGGRKMMLMYVFVLSEVNGHAIIIIIINIKKTIETITI